MTTHSPARIKPNWKMPEAPLCCGQPMVLLAECWQCSEWDEVLGDRTDHDEWGTFAECLVCEKFSLLACEFPYETIRVTAEDMKLAGFIVED